jgi:actin-like ATPase involved in cell morphogenesis
MLRGMDEIMANATGLIVKRVEQPLHSVARGTCTYIENIDLWKDLTEQYDNGVE